MKVVVKELNSNKCLIEVSSKSGLKELEILKTDMGHSYEDFAEWDITDDEYYELERLVDDLMKQMSGNSSLDISFDL